VDVEGEQTVEVGTEAATRTWGEVAAEEPGLLDQVAEQVFSLMPLCPGLVGDGDAECLDVSYVVEGEAST
jgi:hypothetical protein